MPNSSSLSTSQRVSRATTPSSRSRLYLRLLVSILHLSALLFLILVCIGNISPRPVIRFIYLLKIDLTNIVPYTVRNAAPLNLMIHSIGLHDFVQVGLWGFCQGYNDDGITYCSPSRALYWLNPMAIVTDQLVAGATINLSARVTHTLRVVKTASHCMSACFTIAVLLTTAAVLLAPLGVNTRPKGSSRVFRRQTPIQILTFTAAMTTTAASTIAIIIFLTFRRAFNSLPNLTIGAKLGTPMLVFMCMASACNFLGFLIQLGAFWEVDSIAVERQRGRVVLEVPTFGDHGQA